MFILNRFAYRRFLLVCSVILTYSLVNSVSEVECERSELLDDVDEDRESIEYFRQVGNHPIAI